MNRKFLWLIVLAFILLGTFAAASAEQDGRNCWCNIDENGCWATGEDGGKNYIMFWSEDARRAIMGTGSAPYDLVVEKPAQSGILALKCSVPSPVIIPAAAPTAGPDEKPQEPALDCNDIFRDCFDRCDQNYILEDNVDCKAQCEEQLRICFGYE